MKKREERNAYVAKRKLASKIAKIVKDNFWSSMNKIVQFKQQQLLNEKKQKMVDEQLNFILGHTEIYCSHLTKRFHGPKDDKTDNG